MYCTKLDLLLRDQYRDLLNIVILTNVKAKQSWSAIGLRLNSLCEWLSLIRGKRRDPCNFSYIFFIEGCER